MKFTHAENFIEVQAAVNYLVQQFVRQKGSVSFKM
jgi:hypothetical protein